MNSATKDIESKVQFWSLVGPLAMACVLLIVIVRASATVALPLVAVGGVFLCYRWRWRGLAVALGALTIAFGLQFSLTAGNDWLWLSILSLTIASGFILAALSFDQSSHAFEAVDGQSERYKETINQLDDRLRGLHEKLLQERQEFQSHIQQLKSEIGEYCEKAQASEKGVAFARDELAAQEEHQRHLLQELYDSRQYAYQLEQQLATVSYSRTSHAPQEQDFHEQDPFDSADAPVVHVQDANAELVVKYEAEVSLLRGMLEESEMRCRACLQDLQQQALDLAHLQEIHEISTRSSAAAEERQIIQQAIVQELNDHIENLTREKQLLESTLTRLQSELEDVMAREEARSQAFAGNQETIAKLQAALDDSESALKMETAKFQTHKTSSESRERDLILQVEELTRKWAGVSQQIGDWQRKLEDYQQVSEKAGKLQQQLESLTFEKHRLEMETQQLESRIVDLENQCKEAARQPEPLMQEALKPDPIENDAEAAVAAEREVKRLTGLYTQLKEQFAEKSAVLDAARRELFHAQEELQALQRDGLENYVYGDDPVSKEMSRLLAAADEERSRVEQEYRHEIEQLYELIGAFVSGKQPAGAK